jgi:hypothetical protein
MYRPKLFIFCSEQNARLFAITRNAVGANLPSRYGPWNPADRLATQDAVMGAAEEPSDLVVSAVETRGFYLCRTDGNAW